MSRTQYPNTVDGRALHRAGSCLHECATSAQREAWEAEAYEQQAIGRELRLSGAPRSECDGIDQEHGWDNATTDGAETKP